MGSANRSFWRENKADLGDNWRQVELFRYSEHRQAAARRPRKRKMKSSSPGQHDLNEKKSQRYFKALVLANFREGDYAVHATYRDEHLPESFEAAQKQIKLFWDRVAYKCKTQALPKPKWVSLTAEGMKNGRLHHHGILRCALPEKEIRECWWAKKATKDHPAEMLGGINVDTLQDWNGNGILEMVGYISRQGKRKKKQGEELDKEPGKGKKKWTQSQGLYLPKEKRSNDSKFREKTMAEVLKTEVNSPDFRAFLAKFYPGWTAVEVDKNPPNEEWANPGGLYMLLRRTEPRQLHKETENPTENPKKEGGNEPHTKTSQKQTGHALRPMREAAGDLGNPIADAQRGKSGDYELSLRLLRGGVHNDGDGPGTAGKAGKAAKKTKGSAAPLGDSQKSAARDAAKAKKPTETGAGGVPEKDAKPENGV